MFINDNNGLLISYLISFFLFLLLFIPLFYLYYLDFTFPYSLHFQLPSRAKQKQNKNTHITYSLLSLLFYGLAREAKKALNSSILLLLHFWFLPSQRGVRSHSCLLVLLVFAFLVDLIFVLWRCAVEKGCGSAEFSESKV